MSYDSTHVLELLRLDTQSPVAEFRLIAADKATMISHIQRGHLTATKVLIPPRPLLDAITRIMSPIVDQLIANRIQSHTLSTLRDTLLPKLLSGELSPNLLLR